MIATARKPNNAQGQRSFRAIALIAALAAVTLAASGCLKSEDQDPAPLVVPGTDTFSGRHGEIAMLTWIPNGATEALVLYHGASGVKENYWGELSVSQYSAGLIHATYGRAVFGLDLPGYGESTGNYTFDNALLDLHEFVQSLREQGYESIYGLGVSNGAFALGVQQGLYGSFDAIVPIANAPGAASAEYRACSRGGLGHPQGGPCPEDGSDDFLLSVANPAVVQEVVAGYEGMPEAWRPSVAIWNTYTWLVVEEASSMPPEATPYAVALGEITAPALVIVGDSDWFFESDKVAASCKHYGGPCDAIVLENTGHMALHHENRLGVHGQIADWMASLAESSN